MRKNYVIAMLVISVAVALAVVYYFVDPVEVTWMPRCLWKVATGTDCPGCGSQRMAHALMHGDFRAAWHANAYALCITPVVAAMLCLEFNRERFASLYTKVHSPWIIGTLVGSMFLWWLLRNLI